jgi:hypothetical protein
MAELSRQFEADYVCASEWKKSEFRHMWKELISRVDALILCGTPERAKKLITDCIDVGGECLHRFG